MLASAGAIAEVPAGAPAGSTGLCKDGTYSTGAEKKGACKGHKGIKDWYAVAPADKKPPADSKSVATSPVKSNTVPPSVAAAPGGGSGKVWANDSSKVYHCMGDKWYGKTKRGEYLSEAEAKAKGFKADHGKGCQS